MRTISGLLARASALALAAAGALAASVFATGRNVNLGLLGLLLLLVGPGIVLTGSLARRRLPPAVRVTAVLAFSLSVIVLVTVALGASAPGFGPESLGVALVFVFGAAGVAWALRSPVRSRRQSIPRPRLVTSRDTLLLGLALLIGVVATALAVGTARDATRPRFLQLYQEPPSGPGADAVIVVRSQGYAGLVCDPTLSDRRPDGTDVARREWPPITLDGDDLWRGLVPRSSLDRPSSLVATLSCAGGDVGPLDRRIEVTADGR